MGCNFTAGEQNYVYRIKRVKDKTGIEKYNNKRHIDVTEFFLTLLIYEAINMNLKENLANL